MRGIRNLSLFVLVRLSESFVPGAVVPAFSGGVGMPRSEHVSAKRLGDWYCTAIFGGFPTVRWCMSNGYCQCPLGAPSDYKDFPCHTRAMQSVGREFDKFTSAFGYRPSFLSTLEDLRSWTRQRKISFIDRDSKGYNCMVVEFFYFVPGIYRYFDPTNLQFDIEPDELVNFLTYYKSLAASAEIPASPASYMGKSELRHWGRLFAEIVIPFYDKVYEIHGTENKDNSWSLSDEGERLFAESKFVDIAKFTAQAMTGRRRYSSVREVLQQMSKETRKKWEALRVIE